MPSINCSFCARANPADAKFCNECGAGLGLRPCAQCEAINDVSATYCHHCGGLLATLAATAVAAATQGEAGAAPKSPALTRRTESIAKAYDAPPFDAGGAKPAPASPQELASAAERLDAFWRDSMQAVEVARTMKGEEPPAAPRQVDVLPLRVVGETPIIDAHADSSMHRRHGPRAAIAAGLLILGAGIVYFGYERTKIRDAAPVSVPIAITVPNTASGEPAARPLTSDTASTPPGGTNVPAVSGAAPVPDASQPSEKTSVPATPGEPTAVARDAAALPASPPTPPAPVAQMPAPPIASTPPASEAPVVIDAAPAAAPDATRPVAPSATTVPATGARRPSAADVRATARTPKSTSAARGTSPAVRRSALPAPVIAPPPTNGAAVAAGPPVPARACTDSVAALGLCSR